MLDYNRNQAQTKLKSYDHSAKIGKLWHLKEGYKSNKVWHAWVLAVYNKMKNIWTVWKDL